MKITPIPPQIDPSAGKKIAYAVGHNSFPGVNGPVVSIAFTVVHSKEGDVGALHVERFQVTEKSIWRLAALAGAVGYSEAFDPTVDEDLEAVFATGPLVIDLQENTYNGRTRLEIKNFSAWRGDKSEKWQGIVTGGEARWDSILTKIKARLTQSGGAGTTMSNVTTNTDDIPF